jgi:anti-sigma B factor antagonist
MPYITGNTVPPGLVIRAERGVDGWVFALYGELDLASSPQLEDELLQAESNGGRVIIDLSELEFMDSAGLHALLRAHRRCSENGGRMSLRRGPRQVHQLFELTGTARAFSFED